MATFTAVLVVPNELDQEYVIEQLERLGVVSFCGPGSLVQSIGEDGQPEERPDDEAACAGCGVPMFVASSRVAAGAVYCESCTADDASAVVRLNGLSVRVEVTGTEDGPLLTLRGENCGLEGELPGEYYLRAVGGGLRGGYKCAKGRAPDVSDARLAELRDD